MDIKIGSKISVIIPVYNVENLLDRCIESLLHQTYTNIEYILVDDGSSDGSLDKCRDYEQRDNRVKVLHQDQGGVSSARNLGLASVTGEYVTFVDSDDYIEVDMIEKLYKCLQREKVDIALCGVKKHYASNKKCREIKPNLSGKVIFSSIEQKYKVFLNDKPFSAIYCALFKLGLVYNTKFDTNIKCAEDYFFWYQILPVINAVYFMEECLYHYVTNPQSITRKFDNESSVRAFSDHLYVDWNIYRSLPGQSDLTGIELKNMDELMISHRKWLASNLSYFKYQKVLKEMWQAKIFLQASSEFPEEFGQRIRRIFQINFGMYLKDTLTGRMKNIIRCIVRKILW